MKKSQMCKYGTFVAWFAECKSISKRVVLFLNKAYGCDLKAVRHELWAETLSCSVETMGSIINNSPQIYRRKDGKVCLRKGTKI
jgi:hypothetical protein